MSRFHSYINSSKSILETYHGDEPFSFHLKKYFAAHKNMGSKDRKSVSELCYCWLRTYNLFKGELNEDVLLKSLFICNKQPFPILENLNPSLNDKINLPISEKLMLLNVNFSSIFPFSSELGDIDYNNFLTSLLHQPSLFLRIRPRQKEKVVIKLSAAEINYNLVGEDCLELSNSSRIDQILKINKEVVVQDFSSQKVLDYLKSKSIENKLVEVWDACAASGGKSILLYDVLNGKVKLTVTDIREGILQNANKRLQQAGINTYQSFVADLAKEKPLKFINKFEIIICDVPCTGSGTWARTPEQLAFFKSEKINEYASLQKKIALNSINYLKEGGLLFYITCSVFKKENEENVEAILKEKNLELLHTEYLKGYSQKADTLFVAVMES